MTGKSTTAAAGVALLALAACASTPPPAAADAERSFARAAAAAYAGMAALEARTLQDLLDAENHLPAEVRARVLGFAAAGAAGAREQIEAAPDDADGYLLLALNRGMEGVAKGRVKAFLEGVPGDVLRACRRATDLDERIRDGGPLQVMGRFYTIVPFPYRNLKKAAATLEQARAIAPVKQTWFFLGDAYAWQGRVEDARAAWAEALRAEPAEHARELAPLVDELVRLRLTRTASPRP